jgi:hypothetical protein
MGAIISQLLGALAKGLDAVPFLKGHRTTAVAVLVIIGNVAGYLAGQITAEVAGSNIATAIGIIWAAAHKAS